MKIKCAILKQTIGVVLISVELFADICSRGRTATHGGAETYTECKRNVLDILNSAREVKNLTSLVARDVEIRLDQ